MCSLEAVSFQVVHQGVADTALFGAGPHYRDSLRLKKLLENMSFCDIAWLGPCSIYLRSTSSMRLLASGCLAEGPSVNTMKSPLISKDL